MSKPPMPMFFRVALVGAGYVSPYHIRALKALGEVEVVGIADLDQVRAQEVASAFAIPRVFRNLEELAETRPDVVHILTPPASHCPLALQALDIGCHVFVEKPMALSEEECGRVIEKASAVQRILSVNHSARFDPALLEALQLIRDGAIGDVLSVDYVRSSEYPPFAGGSLPVHYRDGGYPFRDIGVHALYVIEAFLGQIRNVEGFYRSTSRHPHLLFDEWRTVVECAKGTGQVHLSWNSRPMQNTIIIQGTGGGLAVDCFLETCTVSRSLPGPKALSLVWNAVPGSVGRAFKVCWNAALFAAGSVGPAPDIQRSIREFYAALAAGGPPPVPAEEGKRIVTWVEKIARRGDADKVRLKESQTALQPATVLVTGATGFLGCALVKALLASDQSLRLLARRRPAAAIAEDPRVSVIEGDLGQPEVVDRAMQGIEVVFHVGATTGGSREDYQSGTIWGTRNVVQSALRHGVKKLIYVSSLSVLDYVRLSTGARVDESTPLELYPEKRGLYAQTKLEAERYVLDATAQGLATVILRPGQIFGPGAKHVPPYGTFALGNRWIVMGRGKMKLPLVYVDDVVDALLLAAESKDAIGQIIQLVDDETVNQKQYLSFCRPSLPGMKVTYVPLPVLYCAAVGLEVVGRLLRRNVPLTIYRLRSLKSWLQFDCGAARQKLRWTPRTGVREGLKKTFADAQVLWVEPGTKSQRSSAH